MKLNVIATALGLVVSGCAHQPGEAVGSSSVQAATAAQVAGCAYIDDLVGTSALYGLFAAQGMDNARADVLQRAAQAGATHVVWGAPVPGHGSTGTSAKAYRCTS